MLAAAQLLRCYLVWGNVWVVVVPSVLLLGSTGAFNSILMTGITLIGLMSVQASGIGILYSFARVVPQADIFVTELQNWITAFFSLTLATNIICTSAHIHLPCLSLTYRCSPRGLQASWPSAFGGLTARSWPS